jgi:hypothetical protein
MACFAITVDKNCFDDEAAFDSKAIRWQLAGDSEFCPIQRIHFRPILNIGLTRTEKWRNGSSSTVRDAGVLFRALLRESGPFNTTTFLDFGAIRETSSTCIEAEAKHSRSLGCL